MTPLSAYLSCLVRTLIIVEEARPHDVAEKVPLKRGEITPDVALYRACVSTHGVIGVEDEVLFCSLQVVLRWRQPR